MMEIRGIIALDSATRCHLLFSLNVHSHIASEVEVAVRIKAGMEKVPGGLMLVPLLIGAVIHTAAPDAGKFFGSFTGALFTGLAPILIDLMERGFVSALALNGAGVIHDFEIAVEEGSTEVRLGTVLFGPRNG
jgi:deoxyhypusine synthase